MNTLILFILSGLPVFLVGLYIYNKDKNKEPSKVLTKLFLGGIISTFIVLGISLILNLFIPLFNLEPEDLNLIELIFYVFISIALVEEFSKWLITYKLSYNTNHLDEIYDLIVYSVFVALGFAFFENMLYVFSGGVSVAITRALLAVPGHACDGAIMGYYLGLAKMSEIHNNKKLKNKNLIYSLIVPTITHGIYDYCLFAQNGFFLLIFFIFVIFTYIISIKKVKRFSSINTKIKYKYNYCPKCGLKVTSNYCPKCGLKNE